jgi:hypothetical protein
MTWTISIVQGQGVQKLTANTKKEALKLIQWSKLNRIQRLEGHVYLVSYR